MPLESNEASDAEFAPLGIHRVAVPVPFLEAGGPVNVYFLENGDGTYSLFDSGLGSTEAEASFRASAEKAGLPLEQVTRIFISHGHVDHYGLAQTLAEQSGATVFVHPADRAKVVDLQFFESRLPLYRDYLRKLGVDETLLDPVLELGRNNGRYARAIDPERLRPLKGGDRLCFGQFEAEVLHLPGHTPGLICLWAAKERLLLADDHVLARISPNPMLELGPLGEEDKFRSLESYLRSAREVQALDVDLVLPGHGPAFRGHRALLERLFGFYGKRQGKLLARMREAPATAVELVNAIFGRAGPSRMYLMLSEVIGNLEVLEARGEVSRSAFDGVYRFAAVAE